MFGWSANEGLSEDLQSILSEMRDLSIHVHRATRRVAPTIDSSHPFPKSLHLSLSTLPSSVFGPRSGKMTGVIFPPDKTVNRI
jgi:hypothetical protein